MRKRIGILAMGMVLMCPMAQAVTHPLVGLAEKGDFLGLRILVRRYAKTNLPSQQWNFIRTLLQQHPEVGSDLIFGWEQTVKKRIGLTQETVITQVLNRADESMLGGKASSALKDYEWVARVLKKRMTQSAAGTPLQRQAAQLYPYVLQSMGRALYTVGRFKDALEVYTWIRPDFPKFRQILFEKMWSAFRAGKVEQALGAVASQRSAFFSPYLEPESYLVQIYLYKVLCRETEVQAVVNEIEKYKADLSSGKITYADWARSELDTRALLALEQTSRHFGEDTKLIRDSDRKLEQKKIHQLLARHFEVKKKRLLEDLESVIAYSRLAVTPGTGSELEPIEKLSGREELLKRGLEIWPADSREEWADEIGTHQFIGESLCSH